ncbi:MAG: macro domain-containing protein [Dorea sp.]|nr:macro domain-containing protein [Dorea sp.]
MMMLAIKSDITRVFGVDAIVNPANNSLSGGNGAADDILEAGGLNLYMDCKALKGCRGSSSKITHGYLLPVPYVIHTVAPVWMGGKNKELAILYDTYVSCLMTAAEYGIRKIAFPSVGTGRNGIPYHMAAEIAVQAVRDFCLQNPGYIDVVYWALLDDERRDLYQQAIMRNS